MNALKLHVERFIYLAYGLTICNLKAELPEDVAGDCSHGDGFTHGWSSHAAAKASGTQSAITITHSTSTSIHTVEPAQDITSSTGDLLSFRNLELKQEISACNQCLYWLL